MAKKTDRIPIAWAYEIGLSKLAPESPYLTRQRRLATRRRAEQLQRELVAYAEAFNRPLKGQPQRLSVEKGPNSIALRSGPKTGIHRSWRLEWYEETGVVVAKILTDEGSALIAEEHVGLGIEYEERPVNPLANQQMNIRQALEPFLRA